METVKGRFQLPVLSIRKPPTTGLIIAASADPEFMMPLAVPACLGAISIGTAHIGPIVISLKKNPPLRHTAANVIDMLETSMMGASESSVRNMQTPTITLRAMRIFPLRRKMRSVTEPPSQSPRTPAKNTPEANNADFPNSM
ncbi:hypothetical protein AWB69_09185 [Caballeronia udeis]|uniref:Uncharacterized protein n=1 Tax=Caballeronia udeis TaxID=1232866 RepID=A0A158K1L1_9BURK|nr:hypothetical protein AWB69_09185 [Caballeronia udeis]